MPLHLTIENEPALTDGGPISITVSSRRGIDIGRDQYLDWVLPDPTRFISGKHCEIRFRDGQFWLTDVSTNGTFVNRSEMRPTGPYALKHGDMIEIGRYVIGVRIEPEQGMESGAGEASAPGPAAGLWDAGGDVAPAINPRELRAPSNSGGIGSNDILDWAAGVPLPSAPQYEPSPAMARPPPPPPPASVDWLMEPQPVATPRPTRPAPPAQSETQAPPPAPATPAPPVAAPAPAPPPPKPALRPEPQFTTRTGYAAGFAWDIEKSDPPTAAEVTQHPGSARPEPEPAAPRDFFADAPGGDPFAEPAAPRAAPAPPRMPAAAYPPASLTPAPMATPSASAEAVLQRFARGLGLPAEHLRARSVEELAELFGALMQVTVENLRQLQAARTQSKGAMRSASHTMIQATDNNAIRFSPTAEEAMRLMFGPPTRSYLPPRETLEASFQDLKTHQMKMLTAMQTALTTLLNDLDPAKIEAQGDDDKGFGALLHSRKAKHWEHYRTLWNAKVGKNEQGMLGVFMLLFADAYDRSK